MQKYQNYLNQNSVPQRKTSTNDMRYYHYPEDQLYELPGKRQFENYLRAQQQQQQQQQQQHQQQQQQQQQLSQHHWDQRSYPAAGYYYRTNPRNDMLYYGHKQSSGSDQLNRDALFYSNGAEITGNYHIFPTASPYPPTESKSLPQGSYLEAHMTRKGLPSVYGTEPTFEMHPKHNAKERQRGREKLHEMLLIKQKNLRNSKPQFFKERHYSRLPPPLLDDHRNNSGNIDVNTKTMPHLQSSPSVTPDSGRASLDNSYSAGCSLLEAQPDPDRINANYNDHDNRIYSNGGEKNYGKLFSEYVADWNNNSTGSKTTEPKHNQLNATHYPSIISYNRSHNHNRSAEKSYVELTSVGDYVPDCNNIVNNSIADYTTNSIANNNSNNNKLTFNYTTNYINTVASGVIAPDQFSTPDYNNNVGTAITADQFIKTDHTAINRGSGANYPLGGISSEERIFIDVLERPVTNQEKDEVAKLSPKSRKKRFDDISRIKEILEKSTPPKKKRHRKANNLHAVVNPLETATTSFTTGTVGPDVSAQGNHDDLNDVSNRDDGSDTLVIDERASTAVSGDNS